MNKDLHKYRTLVGISFLNFVLILDSLFLHANIKSPHVESMFGILFVLTAIATIWLLGVAFKLGNK